MKIDMVSEHASPLAALGGPDSGGQNVHVGALAVALTPSLGAAAAARVKARYAWAQIAAETEAVYVLVAESGPAVVADTA